MQRSSLGRYVFVADESYSPLVVVAAAERIAILRKCRRKLNRIENKLLRLRYEKDLTFLEIAGVFEMTPSAVTQMHKRVLAIMLEQLRKRRIGAIGQIL